MLKVGDKVELHIDHEYYECDSNPIEMDGVVTEIISGTYYVKWANGLDNYYSDRWLVKINQNNLK